VTDGKVGIYIKVPQVTNSSAFSCNSAGDVNKTVLGTTATLLNAADYRHNQLSETNRLYKHCRLIYRLAILTILVGCVANATPTPTIQPPTRALTRTLPLAPIQTPAWFRDGDASATLQN